MTKLVAYFYCSLLLLSGKATSFTLTPSRWIIHPRLLASTAASETDRDHFYRAVEIADSIRASNSKINIEELDQWATELEQVTDCPFEDAADANKCQQEIQDRLEVAQIFRLEIELKLRLEYLKDRANLFAEDVRKNHDKVEREKFKQALLENRDKMSERGVDLGLW